MKKFKDSEEYRLYLLDYVKTIPPVNYKKPEETTKEYLKRLKFKPVEQFYKTE